MPGTSPIPTVEANGAAIPVVGLGTSGLRGDACLRAVEAALEEGYRHIDTAVMYGNEAEIGRALAASKLPRGGLFITTKVLPSDIGAGALQDSARSSLERLRLDHVDLLLIHWPNGAIPLAESIKALCEAKALGLAKHIGVANFPTAMLDEAVRLAAGHGQKLVANQCEHHPRLDQTKLLADCRRHGVALVSYCPIGKGGLLGDPAVAAIAKRLGKAPSQVVLRWHTQQPGVVAIPKSSQRAHLAENIRLFDFELSKADMAALSAMASPNGRLVRPGFAPVWD
jgi:diketogulonate reductase-like aldo/keto reductase